MKVKEVYNSKIKLECSCPDLTPSEWDRKMYGAVKANGKKIRQMIKFQLPDLYADLSLQFPNPFEGNCQRTKTHLIYVHSAIEYFLKII